MYQVTIGTGWTVTLPGGQKVTAGDLADLTDEQFKQLPASAFVTQSGASAPMISAYSHGPAVGTVLRRVEYNPGTQALVTTSSTSLADVDATNLAATFIVPASGRVEVELEACLNSGVTGYPCMWGLRVGGADVAGTTHTVTALGDISRQRTSILVTGLTAGATVTWKFAHAATTPQSNRLLAGGTWGPATMIVKAA